MRPWPGNAYPLGASSYLVASADTPFFRSEAVSAAAR